MSPDTNHQHTSRSSDFVRKYLTGIFLIIGLILLSVFWGFSYRSNALIKNQLLKQGQAFFTEVVITREWAATHGGVYVRLTPDTVVNPYLLKIPGLKVVIKDQDGVAYTLKNPALMTRELSELAANKGMVHFKITSLTPLNPNNRNIFPLSVTAKRPFSATWRPWSPRNPVYGATHNRAIGRETSAAASVSACRPARCYNRSRSTVSISS